MEASRLAQPRIKLFWKVVKTQGAIPWARWHLLQEGA